MGFSDRLNQERSPSLRPPRGRSARNACALMLLAGTVLPGLAGCERRDAPETLEAAFAATSGQAAGAPRRVPDDGPYAFLFVGANDAEAQILLAGLASGRYYAACALTERDAPAAAELHLRELVEDFVVSQSNSANTRALFAALENHADRIAEHPPQVVMEASARRVQARISDASSVGEVSDHAHALRRLVREAARAYAEAGAVEADRSVRMRENAWGYVTAAEVFMELRRAEYERVDPAAAERLLAELARAHAELDAVFTEAIPPEASVRVLATQLELAIDPFT